MSDRFSIRYAKAVIAYHIVMWWPGLMPRWMFWLLPSAGDYAHWDEPCFVEIRQEERAKRRATSAALSPETDQ